MRIEYGVAAVPICGKPESRTRGPPLDPTPDRPLSDKILHPSERWVCVRCTQRLMRRSCLITEGHIVRREEPQALRTALCK